MAGIIRREQLGATQMFSLADMESEGKRIIARARAEAEQIISNANHRGRQLGEQQRKAGHAQGLEEGRAAGRERAYAEARQQAREVARTDLAALVQALQQSFTEFEQSKRRLLAGAENGLIDLALAIARRVCKVIPESSPEPARANVKAALDLARHIGDADLHVNPAELEALREVGADLLQSADASEHVHFVADESVARGGCKLISRTGEVDATLETQLARIAAVLGGAQPETSTESATDE